MRKPVPVDQLKLSWDEIRFIAEGLALAPRPLKIATQGVTEEYSLGPRGAWILLLITSGRVYPVELTNVFRIGRSLVTAELIRLTEARLISYRKSTGDRRRVELALTPLGEKVALRAREEFSKVITQRLSVYTREEVLLFARMLHDFILPQTNGVTLPADTHGPIVEACVPRAPSTNSLRAVALGRKKAQ